MSVRSMMRPLSAKSIKLKCWGSARSVKEESLLNREPRLWEAPFPSTPSGGLVSKGHPVGSTGLSMIYEIVTQLRGEAGPRQVSNARVGLTENGGGVISTEEFACSIILLEKA